MSEHKILIGNSNDMNPISDESVNLIVTSPPYPMVEMWDEILGEQNAAISDALNTGDGMKAFKEMHKVLNDIWKECDRVLSKNGFICINIGDATRTINGDFKLYSNHTMVVNYFASLGYSVLPDIHWRKQTNAPNRFMGSGMYPAGAYVTYEHEYILIFRKGGKRVFNGEERKLRQKSAYFWEERNVWFSDLWDIKGTSQMIYAPKTSRERSAAFPFEIPYRLINMYSVEGDTVLDPFVGLGTTTLAAMATNRNSYGIEIDKSIADIAMDTINNSVSGLNNIIDARISAHHKFIENLPEDKKGKCYENINLGCKVKTRQEKDIAISKIKDYTINDYAINCNYY